MTQDERDSRQYGNGGPVTSAELARWLQRHEASSNRTHEELARIIEKLDERTDRINLRVTVIFAVVSVLWAIFLVIAPLLRQLIGLPGG